MLFHLPFLVSLLATAPATPAVRGVHDLILGYGFFRDFVVTFDYPGRRIQLTH